jgi:hypothetical protein
MPKDQVIMGATIAALCAAGLWKGNWIVENTRKGRRLVAWFGPRGALWALRVLMAFGVVFGVLLAADWIRPVQWR